MQVWLPLALAALLAAPAWADDWTNQRVNTAVQGVPYSATAPTSGQVYEWNGTQMVPTNIPGSVAGTLTSGNCIQAANQTTNPGQFQDTGSPCGNNPAGTVTGAIAHDMSGYRQAATSDLSDISTCAWTPTDASGGGNAFLGVSTVCLKIGKLIHLQAFFTYPTSPAGASLAAAITLPFAAPSTSYANIYYPVTSSGVMEQGYIAVGGSALTFVTTNAAGITNTGLAGSNMRITMDYVCASC